MSVPQARTSPPTSRPGWGRLARPKEASMAQVPLLERLGLHRPELRAWAMYDWANSAFQTTIITAIFPVYFISVASAGLSPAEATRRLAAATTIALTISAVIAPILGAIADYAPIKKRLLGAFMTVGALASGALFFIQRGDWRAAALLFGIGN